MGRTTIAILAAFLAASCESDHRERSEGRLPRPHGKATWPEPPPTPNAFDLNLFPAAVNVLPGTVASTDLSVWWEGEPVPLELRIEGMPAGFSATVEADRVNVHASETVTLEGHAVASLIATDGVGSDVVPFAIFSQPSSAALDLSFGDEGVVKLLHRVNDVVEMDDGALMLVGPSDFDPTLCRLTKDGARDGSFGEMGCVAFTALSYAAQGQHLLRVPGGFVIAGGQVVWRVHEDGSIDSSFSHDGSVVDPTPMTDYIRGAAAGIDGSVIVTGETHQEGGGTTGFVVRFKYDGSIDWTLLLPRSGMATAVLEDERILVLSDGVRAFLPDGSPDISFGESGVQAAARGWTMTVHGSDVFVGGGALQLTRLDGAGAILSVQDDGGASFESSSLRIAPDGSIVFGGTMNGEALSVGRRTPDGFIDVGLAPGGTATFRDSDSYAGALPLRDGRMLVYGACPESEDTEPPSPGLVIRIEG